MRYGAPSILTGLQCLVDRGCEEILVVPLYPHYAQSSTLSTIEKVRADVARTSPANPRVDFYPAFYDHPAFIEALAAVTGPELESFRPDRILMSFHGLPERQMPDAGPGRPCLVDASCCDSVRADNQNCYRAQCYATARALARRLKIEDRYQVSFQSRLGRTKWIEPHTDKILTELAQSGCRRLAVLCPAFVADCLETLEEIGMRADEQFRSEGGEALHLVPCLNAHPAWVSSLESMIREALA
jgi:ferrochelatase